jgi:hypothetical protein
MRRKRSIMMMMITVMMTKTIIEIPLKVGGFFLS